MRLRQPLPSDPRLRLQVTSVYLYRDNPMSGVLVGRVWAEEGSATAHGVAFRLEPFGCHSPKQFDDLPYPSLRPSGAASSLHNFRYEGFTSASNFDFPNLDLSTVPASIRLIATCKDESGLTWEVRRRISLTLSKGQDRPELEHADLGEFRRRIILFPPKVEAHP